MAAPLSHGGDRQALRRGRRPRALRTARRGGAAEAASGTRRARRQHASRHAVSRPATSHSPTSTRRPAARASRCGITIPAINATLLFTTKDDDASFVLLQRSTGKQTTLPSEPALAPIGSDSRRRISARQRCENRLVVWRVSRERRGPRGRNGSRRSRGRDAAVRWKDPATLIVEYTPAGASEPQDARAQARRRRLDFAGPLTDRR